MGADALGLIAEQLRAEGTPISEHLVDAPAGEGYGSMVLDSIREGYLLHYGEPRLLAGHDEDLAVLAGDYLYALGITRLAATGDCGAVLRLAELIGGCARRHVEGREDEVPALWDATVAAIDDGSASNQ